MHEEKFYFFCLTTRSEVNLNENREQERNKNTSFVQELCVKLKKQESLIENPVFVFVKSKNLPPELFELFTQRNIELVKVRLTKEVDKTRKIVRV